MVYVRHPDGGFEAIPLAERESNRSKWNLIDSRVFFSVSQKPARNKWRASTPALMFMAMQGPRLDDHNVTDIQTSLNARLATLFYIAGSIPCAIVPTTKGDKKMEDWYQASFSNQGGPFLRVIFPPKRSLIDFSGFP